MYVTEKTRRLTMKCEVYMLVSRGFLRSLTLGRNDSGKRTVENDGRKRMVVMTVGKERSNESGKIKRALGRNNSKKRTGTLSE